MYQLFGDTSKILNTISLRVFNQKIVTLLKLENFIENSSNFRTTMKLFIFILIATIFISANAKEDENISKPTNNFMQEAMSVKTRAEPIPLTTPYTLDEKKQPDTMSNFEALAYTYSQGFNILQKNLFDKQATKVAPAATTEQLMRVIAAEQDQFIYSGLVDGLDDFKTLADVAARRQYLVHLKNAQEQVANNFGTVESFIVRIPFVLFNIEIILIAFIIGLLFFVFKVLKLRI